MPKTAKAKKKVSKPKTKVVSKAKTTTAKVAPKGPVKISKIDSALKRIKDGTYGFCEDTGEPIGLKRLIARPVATLTIAAQEKHEKEEKVFADD